MESKELRIGNFITRNQKMIVVEDVMANGINLCHDCWLHGIEEIEPIQLTQEWFIKFGFELKPNSGYWKRDLKYYSGEIPIFIDGDTGKFYLGQYSRDYDCEQFGEKEIEYVHQLQNLYFALVGNELE